MNTNQMDFGAALREIKAGRRVGRLGWNGKGMYLFLSSKIDIERVGEPAPLFVKCAPSVCMKTAQDTICVGWLASQADMLAEDWVVVS